MSKLELPEKTKLEKISGALPTEIGATLIAVFSATPVAALLPTLMNALASGRHKERVERAIADMSAELERQKDVLVNITDAQYKLVNETILATLQATDEEKLQYLRHVLSNAICADTIEPQEADFLSRVIRNMSAKEATFLIDKFHYERIQLNETTVGTSKVKVFLADPSSEDGIIVTGLISLGLLIPAEPTWDNSGFHRWSSAVSPLIALLKSNNLN
jgi:hemoglobin-like flavoprotein